MRRTTNVRFVVAAIEVLAVPARRETNGTLKVAALGGWNFMNVELIATSEKDGLICLIAVVVCTTESISGKHAEASRESTGLTWDDATTRWVIVTRVVLVVHVLEYQYQDVIGSRSRQAYRAEERHKSKSAVRILLVKLRTPVVAVVRVLVTSRCLRVCSVVNAAHVPAECRATDDRMDVAGHHARTDNWITSLNRKRVAIDCPDRRRHGRSRDREERYSNRRLGHHDDEVGGLVEHGNERILLALICTPEVVWAADERMKCFVDLDHPAHGCAAVMHLDVPDNRYRTQEERLHRQSEQTAEKTGLEIRMEKFEDVLYQETAT
jgi:hypothetical protein